MLGLLAGLVIGGLLGLIAGFCFGAYATQRFMESDKPYDFKAQEQADDDRLSYAQRDMEPLAQHFPWLNSVQISKLRDFMHKERMTK